MAKTMKTKMAPKSAPPKNMGMAKARPAPIPKTRGRSSSRKA